MRLFAAALLLAFSLPALSHSSAAQAVTYKDTSIVRAPAGARVAIYDFEDLECPACARAFPIVHQAADHYKIPIVRHDFPLQMHIWSRDGAIIARYIQDKISPAAAEDYRRAVFADQVSISTKEDLQAFTQKYFQSHGRTMPFVIDPTGQFAKEVQADYDLGVKIGLIHTPTIFVVTPHGENEVTDLNNLYSMIDSALAATPAATPAPSSKLRHSPSVQR